MRHKNIIIIIENLIFLTDFRLTQNFLGCNILQGLHQLWKNNVVYL